MSNRRRSINIAGVSHGAPIPMGSRVGDIVYSSGISGADPASGEMPIDAKEQVRRTFENLASFLDAAGVSADDIVRMTIYVKDRAIRSAIDEQWLALFPDEDSRPARHVLIYDLPGGMHLQLEIVAVAS